MLKMKHFFLALICGVGAFPLFAAERAAFGVVATDWEPQIHRHLPVRAGAVVDSVWPGSPADKAGVTPGSVITAMDGEPMLGRESLSSFLARRKPGDRVKVELFADGSPRVLTVTLTQRPAKAASGRTPDQLVGGDRVKRPVRVTPEIVAAMKQHRANICRQLASMPENLNPDAVVDELQAIRNLARDTNAADKAWMPGKAGEAAIQLRDSEGTLQLRGANNSLILEAYDPEGKLCFQGRLDTAELRRRVPDAVLQRLRRL